MELPQINTLTTTNVLLKYCLYAWLAPALVVSLTVLIDRRLNEGYFGYGK